MGPRPCLHLVPIFILNKFTDFCTTHPSITMSTLYSSLSPIYEAMYQQFINYDEEFDFYNKILKSFQPTSVLEIGCGTGHLAKRFHQKNYAYTGVDISPDMLSIAQGNNPHCHFIKADMRRLALPTKQQACLITGRTISYLLSNEDLFNTLESINRNLHNNGLLCFDFIDATRFIPSIKADEVIVHSALVESIKYQRRSYWSVEKMQSWTFHWRSFFYEENENNDLIAIGEDHSTIRAFTKEDIAIFLQQTGFELLKMIDRKTYAFDTYVVVAKKINPI